MPTLTDQVSKVTVTRETMNKAQDAAEMVALRKQIILDLIRSKPAGTYINLQEFATATGTTNRASVFDIIKKMMKKRLITRYELSPRKYSYAVVGDARIIAAPITVVAKPLSGGVLPEAPKPAPVSDDTEQLAMRFAWDHPEHRDSLHAFITWMKGKK